MTITNLIPIRVDAHNSDGTVRIIDTLLIDTTCLPISHVPRPRPHDGTTASTSAEERHKSIASDYSIPSLVAANASHLTESILTDAEVYGAVRSSKHYLAGRLDLLSDTKLYMKIYGQISAQLSIALNVDKEQLLLNGSTLLGKSEESPMDTTISLNVESNVKEEGNSAPDGTTSTEQTKSSSNIIRIKLRLRQESIVVVDEFDYDVNTSGCQGCDPFSIANSIVQDLKLPLEFATSIAASIVEQIYGVQIRESLDGMERGVSRDVPAAYVVDVAKEGPSSTFSQMLLDSDLSSR